MVQQTNLRGGELNAAITSAIVGIFIRHNGRGPSRASTIHADDPIVTLLHRVMTPAEESLVAAGHRDEVSRMRQLVQDTTQPNSPPRWSGSQAGG